MQIFVTLMSMVTDVDMTMRKQSPRKINFSPKWNINHVKSYVGQILNVSLMLKLRRYVLIPFI